VGKLIIDTVISLQRGDGSLSDLWRLVLLEVLIVVVGDLMARTSTLIESLLGTCSRIAPAFS